MSFQDLATNKVYELKPGNSIIMGRGKYDIKSQYISRQHLEVSYLEDRRCFVKRLSEGIVRLNKAFLPKNEEVQVENEDIIAFFLSGKPNGETISFKFTLPVLEEPLFREVLVSNRQGGRYHASYDAHYKGKMEDIADPLSSVTRITGFESEEDLSASELSDESDLL